MKIVLGTALAMSLAPAAFAKAPHCVGPGGAEMASATTKKDCKKAGGKWMKPKAKKGGGTADTSAPSGSTTPK